MKGVLNEKTLACGTIVKKTRVLEVQINRPRQKHYMFFSRRFVGLMMMSSNKGKRQQLTRIELWKWHIWLAMI
jgi:hypothetical protein